MRKKITLLLVAIMTIGAANAQWRLGVVGGVDWNWHLQDYGYALDAYSNQNKLGGVAMLTTQYNFTKHVGLRMDLGWAQRNYQVTRFYQNPIGGGEVRDGYYYTTYTRNYGMLPITISFSVGGHRVRSYIDLGGFVGYNFGGTMDQICVYNGSRDESGCAKESIMFDSKRDVRIDAGLVGRFGLVYYLPHGIYLNIEVTDYWGFVNCHKTGSGYITEKAKDNTLGLQFGIGYVFNSNE